MREITQYLSAKGYEFKRVGNEDKFNRCPFCGDTRWTFSCSDEAYYCHSGSCDAKGNLFKLKQHFNDVNNPIITPFQKYVGAKEYIKPPKDKAEGYHTALFSNQPAFNYLRKRGLSLETIQYFKLGYKKTKDTEWISIPYYENGELINFKYRSLPPADKKFYREKGAKSALFNQDCLKGGKEVILTEGEMDAVMCWQSGLKNVVSVCNGSKAFEPEWIDQLRDMEKIYVWYDNDDPGRTGMDEVVRRLGIDRCWIIQEEGFKDANEYFLCNESYDLTQAKQKKLDNVIHFFDSVFKIFEHEKNFGSEIKTPWENVNRLLGNIENGDLITMSATPKTGKSSLALNMATYNAKRGYPVLFYCLEMRPERLAKKVIQAEGMISVESFNRERALGVAERLYNIPLHFGYNYKNIDVESVFQTIRAATSRYGLKLVIFDHLHFLVRSIAHVSAEVGNVTRSFKLLAEELHIPIILIAQPRKVSDDQVMTMNDLKDSASIGADSDQVVVLWRKKTKANTKNMVDQDGSFVPETLVRIDASRHTAGGDTFLYFKGEYSLFTAVEKKGRGHDTY